MSMLLWLAFSGSGSVRPLHMEQALFDAMLSGWRSQQAARYIKANDRGERVGGPTVR
jgi:hypothetical protein